MVGALAQAAVTNCHRLGGLNNKHLFLSVEEAGKCEVKVPEDLASWFADDCLLGSSHCRDQRESKC